MTQGQAGALPYAMDSRQVLAMGSAGPGRGLWLAAASVAAAVACADDTAASSLGAACDSDRDCETEGLVCGLSTGATFDDIAGARTMCVHPKGDSGAPGDPCQGAEDCHRGLCAVSGTCVTACAVDADCEQVPTGPIGRRCQAMFVTDDGAPGALAVRGCARAVTLGANIAVEHDRLVDAVTADGGQVMLRGTDEPTLFVIAHGSDALFPYSERCRPPLCPLSLRAADRPTPLFDGAALGDGPPAVPIATPSSSFPLTVYLGSRPNPPHASDGYVLELESELPGDVIVTSLAGAPTATRLDLNIFYVTRAWEPEGARGPDPLARALDIVDDIFAQADIFIGDVRQRRLPDDLVRRGNTFEGPDSPGAGFDPLARRFGVWAELPALFALSAGAGNSAINIFLVDRIDGTAAGSVRGLSGGTPGPWGMHGTGASGIAVAIDGADARPTDLGRTIAHELAHHLGLFHTSESDGTVLDPLSDTPLCTLDRDNNGDGTLQSEECAEQGADNLMFWAASGGTALSAEQALVLRRALVLQ